MHWAVCPDCFFGVGRIRRHSLFWDSEYTTCPFHWSAYSLRGEASSSASLALSLPLGLELVPGMGHLPSGAQQPGFGGKADKTESDITPPGPKGWFHLSHSPRLLSLYVRS